MKYRASAPSNIALIKYMGKSSYDSNLPSNSSLSYTLPHLKTEVELEVSDKTQWKPLRDGGVELSESGYKRFTGFLDKLCDTYDVKEHFTVRSANNFPGDSGLASSASSFAALTLSFFEYLKTEKKIEVSREEMAQISRQGSGSSCRSFFGPWCLWDSKEGRVREVEFPLKNLIHLAVVVSRDKKKVASSEAHRRVQTSPLYETRTGRAENRLVELTESFQKEDWEKSYQIVKSEFWDMMGLFHTSDPGFSYLKPGSQEALNLVDDVWEEKKDGPLVTMDAGPNVHLLFRQDQDEMAREFESKLSNFSVMAYRGVIL